MLLAPVYQKNILISAKRELHPLRIKTILVAKLFWLLARDYENLLWPFFSDMVIQ